MAVAVLVALPLTAVAQEGSAPFVLTRNLILVPVSINNTGPYSFILDVGAPHPVIALDAAQSLKLDPDPNARIDARDATGHPITAQVVRAGEFQVAGLAARDVPLVAMDLAPLTAMLGMGVAGLFSGRELGTEICIDFARTTLLVRRGAAVLNSEKDPWTTLCRFGEAGGPRVSALVDGKHVRAFVVDTAFSGTLAMPEAALKEAGLLTETAPRLVLDRQGEAAAAGATQVRLKRIRVGGAEMLDPLCTIGPPGGEARLGIGFLSHFRVTLNTGKELLRLEPVAEGPQKDPPVFGVGLAIDRFQDGYWTVWVAKGSPAARAGIVSGAVLLEVDGKSMKDLSYPGATERIGIGEGAQRTVSVSQGGGAMTVTLIGERLL
jgi:predicted aspartyl protease